MAGYVLSNKAVEDLSEIWSYTREAWSEHQADAHFMMLLDTCRDLADGKVAGRSYQVIQLDVSGFRIGHHIVFYRGMGEGEIEITKILHSRMDLKSRMQDLIGYVPSFKSNVQNHELKEGLRLLATRKRNAGMP